MSDRLSDLPVGTVHDHGCRCWPHVSKSDFDAVALAEYRDGKRAVAEAVAAERARIRAAVEGLAEEEGDGYDSGDPADASTEGWNNALLRVLAIIDGRVMTLRDALAAALHTAGVNDDHSPYTPESVAALVLSDPAFREALVEAVAEAASDVWWTHPDVFDPEFARASWSGC